MSALRFGSILELTKDGFAYAQQPRQAGVSAAERLGGSGNPR